MFLRGEVPLQGGGDTGDDGDGEGGDGRLLEEELPLVRAAMVRAVSIEGLAFRVWVKDLLFRVSGGRIKPQPVDGPSFSVWTKGLVSGISLREEELPLVRAVGGGPFSVWIKALGEAFEVSGVGYRVNHLGSGSRVLVKDFGFG